MVEIGYALSLPRPASHLFHVEISVRGLTAEHVDFVLPSWTPGSYRVRDFARHVQDFSAGPLRWRKMDKARWRVFPMGAREVRISYRVWAFELTVRTCHLDADHGYANGAGVFCYVEGCKELPVRLRVKPPRGWRVFTGLDEVGPNLFRASDYDALVDCPLEVGDLRPLGFRVRGVPHRLVIHGPGNYDEKELVRDVRKIVESEVRMMRGIPYRHYTFLLHTTPEDGGGLEHRNSSSLAYPYAHFRPRERYERFLTLVAHEFFHLWNVKRIRPEPLGPFDYEREVYTSLLWVMEGITSYYDMLIPCRAKLYSASRYLKKLAERIQKFEETPGRKRQSLAEASFDAWIKFYQPNENAPNCQMSYYEKGALVGLALDLEIRARTGNRKSLDDVMRLLYSEYGKAGKGLPEGEFQRACERIAAADLSRFFAKYVDGTDEIPWHRVFETVGLEWVREPKKDENGVARPSKSWLGVSTQRSGDRLIVISVVEGSPADLGGLAPKDELVAMDGARVEPDGWEKRVEEAAAGRRLRIALFRRGYLRDVEVVVGRRPNVGFALKKLAKVSAQQKCAYEGWLESRWRKE